MKEATEKRGKSIIDYILTEQQPTQQATNMGFIIGSGDHYLLMTKIKGRKEHIRK